jgi:hypothetical protein
MTMGMWADGSTLPWVENVKQVKVRKLMGTLGNIKPLKGPKYGPSTWKEMILGLPFAQKMLKSFHLITI